MNTARHVSSAFLLPGGLRGPALGIGWAKEFRDIAPFWLAGVVSTLVCWVAASGMDAGFEAPVALAWWAGHLVTVALGAAVFGHEFAHGTMGLMLTQPLARAALWGRKMRVLAAAMGLLAGLRLAAVFFQGDLRGLAGTSAAMTLLTAWYGLLVAPLLALWSRSTLAATVFGLALPLVTYQAVRVELAARLGADYLWTDASTRWFTALVILQGVVAVVLGRHVFLRLQLAGQGSQAIRLPAWTARRPAAIPRRTGWLVRLASKEIRLLAPAFIVAAMYLVAALADLLVARWTGGTAELTRFGSGVHTVFISLLVGALACAEERPLGTLTTLLVQPVSAARQWAVKCGVALGVTVLLALGLPWLVWMLRLALVPPAPWPGLWSFAGEAAGPRGFLAGAGLVTGLCTVGLYCSSVAATGLRAMLWAVPGAFVLLTVRNGLLESSDFQNRFVPFVTVGHSFACPLGVLTLTAWIGAWALVLGVTLACAGRNFRRLDLSSSRMAGHATVIGLTTAVAVLANLLLAGVIRGAGWALTETPATREARLADACRDRLSLLHSFLAAWYVQHDGTLPDGLSSLEAVRRDPSLLGCPAGQDGADGADVPAVAGPGAEAYRYRRSESGEAGKECAELFCPLHSGRRTLPPVQMQYELVPPARLPHRSPPARD